MCVRSSTAIARFVHSASRTRRLETTWLVSVAKRRSCPLRRAQPAPGRARVLALELAAQASVAVANVLDMRAAVGRAVTIDGDVRHAKINAQHAVNFVRRRLVYDADGKQVEHALAVHEIGFAASRGQQRELAVAAHKRDRLPPVECPDRDAPVVDVPPQNPVVVGNRAVLGVRTLFVAIEPVAVADLGQHADDQLRRQAEPCAQLAIAALLEIIGAKGLLVPGKRARGVGSRIGRFKRALERVSLSRRWLELHLRDDSSHK